MTRKKIIITEIPKDKNLPIEKESVLQSPPRKPPKEKEKENSTDKEDK